MPRVARVEFTFANLELEFSFPNLLDWYGHLRYYIVVIVSFLPRAMSFGFGRIFSLGITVPKDVS